MRSATLRDRLEGDTVTNASAAPATPEHSPRLALLAAAAEENLQSALARFQSSLQDWLDSPLDAGRVLEWTSLRAAR